MTRSLRSHIALVTVLFVAFCHSASATSYASPSDRVVKSLGGKFELAIKAKSGQHIVRKSDQPAKILWSFSRPVWHHDYYVSSDGTYVVWVALPYVQTDELKNPAIVIYSAKGVVVEWTFNQVGGARRYNAGEIGPIGDFWRIWREEVNQTGDVVQIVTPSKKRVTLDLAKGPISIQ